ncbi:MAG: hypothetical protein RMM98_09590 [Acidobacteriota bacterium]|nr:hypothetical protein [Blastocatellia bacterium]MDW8239856.1 hypothetical protein [Acidobacteriota bacterium]
MKQYLIGLIYCDTRTTCLSLSALRPWVSHDTLSRLLQAGLSRSGQLWTGMACRSVQAGGDLMLDDTR